MTATEGPFDDAIREALVEIRAVRKAIERIERAQPKPIGLRAAGERRICDPEVLR